MPLLVRVPLAGEGTDFDGEKVIGGDIFGVAEAKVTGGKGIGCVDDGGDGVVCAVRVHR